jgi:hypothetical protein
MKEMVIEEMTKMGMDSTDKILLGQAYGVLDWLFSGYKELVERDEPISRTEGRRLGTDIVTGLCHVREAAMQAKNVQMGKGRKKVHDFKSGYKYEDKIRREFAQELKDAKGPPKISGTERPHIDDSPRVPLMFTPVRNDKFYIEHVVFLVRFFLKIYAYKTGGYRVILCLGRGYIVQGTSDRLRWHWSLRDYFLTPCASGW